MHMCVRVICVFICVSKCVCPCMFVRMRELLLVEMSILLK